MRETGTGPMADPTRGFAIAEIENSVENYGGWIGWIGQNLEPDYPVLALQWMASQGDELPEELHELRDVIAQFGHAPIEEAVARVQGLERAFREIEKLKHAITHGEDGDQIQEIVDSCVKFSGGFGDGEEVTDA